MYLDKLEDFKKELFRAIEEYEEFEEIENKDLEFILFEILDFSNEKRIKEDRAKYIVKEYFNIIFEIYKYLVFKKL